MDRDDVVSSFDSRDCLLPELEVGSSTPPPPSYCSTTDGLFDVPSLEELRDPAQDDASPAQAPEPLDALAPETVLDTPTKRQSSLVALLHIVCFTAGVGVLNLPKVVSEAGWISISLFPIVAIVVDYTSKRIISCLYLPPPVRDLEAGRTLADALQDKDVKEKLNKTVDSTESLKRLWASPLLHEGTENPSVTRGPFRMDGLPEVGQAAFGRVGNITVHVFHKIVLFGICVVFLVLAGDAVQQLFNGWFHLYEWQWILIITGLLAVPILFLKGMEEVVWTSAVGFAATVFLVIVTTIICCMEIAAGNFGSAAGIEYTLVDWSHMPIAMAGISFAYCGNFVYPKIEETMRRPHHFGRTISVSMGLITAMYVPVASLAYLVYGNAVQSPILRSFPYNGWVIALLIFISAHVLATLPLPLVTLIMETEERLGITEARKQQTEEGAPPQSRTKRIFLRYSEPIIRLGFLASISLIACLFYGSFTDIMDFFGAVSNSLFLFIFPSIFYIKLKGWRNIPIYELIFNFLIVLLGLMTTIIGGYQAGYNLFTSFKVPFSSD